MRRARLFFAAALACVVAFAAWAGDPTRPAPTMQTEPLDSRAVGCRFIVAGVETDVPAALDTWGLKRCALDVSGLVPSVTATSRTTVILSYSRAADGSLSPASTKRRIRTTRFANGDIKFELIDTWRCTAGPPVVCKVY